MRFFACLKKDLRLLTGGGLKSLLLLALPAALTLGMLLGLGTFSKGGAMPEFAVAVRDLDGTVMSRVLTAQLDHVGIFRPVIRASGETDAELKEAGCAAVITIPKDFFYDLYDMRDTDVTVALNRDMPTEAVMVKTVLTSIIGILEENQRAAYAEARVRFGELDGEKMQEVYRSYSQAAADDALSRLDYMGLSSLYGREYDSKRLFFAAGMLSMTVMFIPLCLLRSVSEEFGSGLMDRFLLTGGKAHEALLSKFTVALVSTALPAALILALLRPGGLWALIPALAACFMLSFAFFLLLGLLVKKPSSAQLAGSLVMLAVLTLGGAFYPAELGPAALRQASRFMLPQVLARSMQYAYAGMWRAGAVRLLVPVLIAAAVLFAASLLVIRSRRRA